MKIRKVHVLNQDTLVVSFSDGTVGLFPAHDLIAWSQKVLLGTKKVPPPAKVSAVPLDQK